MIFERVEEKSVEKLKCTGVKLYELNAIGIILSSLGV